MSRTQKGIPKLLVALLLLVLIGNIKPLYAASGLAAPLKYSQQIYADYDAELREATPRSDGYYHVDTPALIAKLLAGHITTYAYLVYHDPTDWDDFRLEFLPAAQNAGINVWLYLVAPSEFYGSYVPYGNNYISWASAAGQLAQQYPVLTALAIDDFDSNESYLTPSYVNSMMAAAHVYAPGLAFLPVNYDASHDSNIGKTISTTFVNAYGSYISGVIMPYLDWTDAPNYGNYSGESAQISKNAGILGNIPLIVMIYDGGYSLGNGQYWRPSSDYVTQANNIAQTSVLNGTAKGIIQYAMDKRPSSTQFPIITCLYSKWQDIDAFIRGHDNACWHKHDNGLWWGSWQSLGAPTGGFGVDQMGWVENWNPGSSELLGVDTNSNCWFNWCNYGTWSGWTKVPVGGNFNSGAAATSKAANQFDVFLRGGASNDCQHICYNNNNGTWSIESLGGAFMGGFGACSMSPGTLDVFGRGTDNALWYNYFDGAAWHGWTSLGGILTSDPAVVSWGPNDMGIFWRGNDDTIYYTYYGNGTWGYDQVMPANYTFGTWLSAGSRDVGRVDILARGSDGNLWWNGSPGNGWFGWYYQDIMP